MCDAIEYHAEDKTITVYFDSTCPQVPIRQPNGRVRFYTWGSRRGEYLSVGSEPGHIRKFPLGGYAALEAIKRHEYSNYEPKPVRIIASRFIQIDPMIGPRHFPLKPHEYIQGLLAKLGWSYCVYVVTVPMPEEYEGRWEYWPRVVSSKKSDLDVP